jgi:ribosomal-protein-alanine N-acetyltransferase
MILLNLPERIETSRLILQRLKYEDAEEIFYTYASKEEATTFVSWPTHRSVTDTRGFLEYAHGAWEKDTDFSYSIRLKDSMKMTGSIGILHDDGKVQFGYIISPSHWGNGYATEACQKMMEILRTKTSLHRIWTLVDCENIASIRVLQKSGLIEEARVSKWFRFINQGNEPKDCIFFKLPS